MDERWLDFEITIVSWFDDKWAIAHFLIVVIFDVLKYFDVRRWMIVSLFAKSNAIPFVSHTSTVA